jgi:hypothetical protein
MMRGAEPEIPPKAPVKRCRRRPQSIHASHPGPYRGSKQRTRWRWLRRKTLRTALSRELNFGRVRLEVSAQVQARWRAPVNPVPLRLSLRKTIRAQRCTWDSPKRNKQRRPIRWKAYRKQGRPARSRNAGTDLAHCAQLRCPLKPTAVMIIPTAKVWRKCRLLFISTCYTIRSCAASSTGRWRRCTGASISRS